MKNTKHLLIGTILYYIENGNIKNFYIESLELKLYENKTIITYCGVNKIKYKCDKHTYFTSSQVGDEYFLSKEEAISNCQEKLKKYLNE